MLESEDLISFTLELGRKNPPIKWILVKETEQLDITGFILPQSSGDADRKQVEVSNEGKTPQTNCSCAPAAPVAQCLHLV